MRKNGIKGVIRGKRHPTTHPDEGADRAADLVERQFVATRPNELWVSDITYGKTAQGFLYVCFIEDVFSRRIVGWQMAEHLRAELVLDVLDMGLWSSNVEPGALVAHSDRGSQGGIKWSSQHLELEVGEWDDHRVGQRRRRGGHRCDRQAGPPVARREHRQAFWEAIARGASSEDAGVKAGVSPAVGTRWFRVTPSRHRRDLVHRYHVRAAWRVPFTGGSGNPSSRGARAPAGLRQAAWRIGEGLHDSSLAVDPSGCGRRPGSMGE